VSDCFVGKLDCRLVSKLSRYLGKWSIFVFVCLSQIQQYVKELNSLESRRGRKPLDINNVVYWFKNARAAQKRAELRGVGPGEFRHFAVSSPLDGDFKRHWPTSLLSALFCLVVTIRSQHAILF
jgi:hypothetical protein